MTASSPATVVVMGSLHYDIMVMAPDRPRKGETLAGTGWHPKLGGKGGNQAVAAARAGAAVAMIGAVGRDAFGTALLEGLDAAGVDRSRVAERAEAPSGMSVAISDQDGDYAAVIVSAANLALDEATVAEHGAAIDSARVLVLQNEVPDSANLAAARRARAGGAVTILNAAPARDPCLGLPEAVDLLVVNAIEAEMLGGGAVSTRREALAAAVLLLDRFGAVVVTAGGSGLAYADRSGSRATMEALPVKVVSTHGAGDAFVGTLAAALARDATMTEALDAANAAAAALVSGQAQLPG